MTDLATYRRFARLIATTAALAALASLPASSHGQGNGAIPDFSLDDVNPSSTTYGASVSPRDYLEQVTGWYFGHAT